MMYVCIPIREICCVGLETRLRLSVDVCAFGAGGMELSSWADSRLPRGTVITRNRRGWWVLIYFQLGAEKATDFSLELASDDGCFGV